MPAGYECHRTHARRRTGQTASLDRVLCPAVVKWWRTKSKRRAVIAMTLATAASGPMNWAAGQCRPVPMRLRAAATADGISSDRRHLHVKSPHREDVDFLAIVLIECRRVRGGETRVDGAHGRYAGRFKLRECGSLLLMDDAWVIHETSPIRPTTALGIRDTLVLTWRGQSRRAQGTGGTGRRRSPDVRPRPAPRWRAPSGRASRKVTRNHACKYRTSDRRAPFHARSDMGSTRWRGPWQRPCPQAPDRFRMGACSLPCRTACARCLSLAAISRVCRTGSAGQRL